MLADGLLKAAHLTMVERLPPLLVANACHSSRVSTGLPGLADEFIGRGVRNLVGTSRAVDDFSARTFSERFHSVLVERSRPGRTEDSCTLGTAVLNGRREVYEDKRPDWDAFQLYGDPEFRFWPVDPVQP
ncbi:MAG: CHAT domain-containing protein [Actinomycetota bacterium]|nr:CHAT domain-containing protein [Actinomycetota bacterium]